MPKFDQHFLVDKNVAEKIVNECNFSKDDIVLEIGPGRGILTERILQKVSHLIVVEIDKVLVEFLQKKFFNCKNLEIVNQDFLNFNLNSLNLSNKALKIVGNIPYCITTPILEKIFLYSNWNMAIIMMQKEVAERVLAVPGTKSFSRLTLWANFYSKSKPIFEVKRTCFKPAPNVDSFVVQFFPNFEYKNFEQKDFLFKVISAVFSQRRKTILNSITKVLKIDKKKVANYLVKSGINLTDRPESISLDKFMKLVENIRQVYEIG